MWTLNGRSDARLNHRMYYRDRFYLIKSLLIDSNILSRLSLSLSLSAYLATTKHRAGEFIQMPINSEGWHSSTRRLQHFCLSFFPPLSSALRCFCAAASEGAARNNDRDVRFENLFINAGASSFEDIRRWNPSTRGFPVENYRDRFIRIIFLPPARGSFKDHPQRHSND